MERLEAGEMIIGDGSYVFTLEKRGYVQAGKYKYRSTQIQEGICSGRQIQIQIQKYKKG